MNKNTAVIVVGAAVLVLAGGRSVASPLAPESVRRAASPVGLVGVSSPDRQDDAIRRVFRDVLNREPTASELRRYRGRMEEDGWSEEDIRNNLRSRSDYRRSSGGHDFDVDLVVRRAYEDILNRQPDREGLREYRSAMVDRGWTEQDVREDLRKSPEYAQQREQSADRIIRRAYQETLGRQPDPAGLASYRDHILNRGWDADDVREALLKSPEYRQRNEMTREKAEDIVRRAYRAVLKRDADAAGMEGYVEHVLRDHWTQAQVEAELRKSPEFRNRR
jgi:hypothetical protein